MKHDRRGITIEAIKEALSFIDENWGEWEGDFQDFMANVISDERVSTYDVERVIRTHTTAKPIDGFEGLSVIRGEPMQLEHYKFKYKPQ